MTKESFNTDIRYIDSRLQSTISHIIYHYGSFYKMLLQMNCILESDNGKDGWQSMLSIIFLIQLRSKYSNRLHMFDKLSPNFQ